MKPQLPSPLGRILVPIFGLLGSLALPFHASAAPPTCTSANINPGPNHPVAFVVAATSPGAVSVVDLATNTVACSIAVGNNPSHLALSPDSSFLLVENDADATVSVINLANPSIVTTLPLNPTLVTPGTSGVTGNIAAAFDGTHSFAYVAVYPNPLPTTTPPPIAPVLGRISLDVSPPTLTSIGSVTVSGTTPANGDVGIAFKPDGSAAYITFDGNNTDVYVTATDTFSTSIPVTGGSFAVSPLGDLAYVVQTAATASSASPNQITIATNAFAATTGSACSQANATTTSPNGSTAYYTCPANNSIQFIDAATNAITNTVNLTTPGSGPMGAVATSDGSSLVVANTNTTISVFTSLSSATPVEANFAGPGGALVGIGQRPPVLSALAPSNPSVPTGSTKSFTAVLTFAKNPSTLTWAVSCTQGGAACGTIDSAGHYTAPSSIPTGGTVTVSVTAPELPPISKLYPLTTIVTITPSQLAFTTAAQTLTAGACSTALTVQSQDSLGNPSNPSSTETLALVSSSGGTFYSNNTCTAVITSASIPTSTNSATFFYKDTKPGSPTITVNGSGSFSATTTQTETVTAGTASALVFTTGAQTLSAGVCSTAITVQSQDNLGNPSNPSTTETLALSSSSTTGTFYSNNTCTTAITSTSIPTSANSATFFYKDTKAASPTITVTGSGAFASTPTQIETVNPAAPSKLVFTTAAQTLTAGVCSTAITMQSQDSFGNPSNPASTETLGLATTSPGGKFYSDSACTATIAGSSISGTTNSATFFSKDTSSGSPTITVTGTGAFSSTVTQIESGAAAAPTKLVFTTAAQTLTAGVCSTAITVQSQDSFNNPSNPTSTETLGLATTSGVGTFYSDNTCTTSITGTSIPTSANSATFFYKDTKAASPTITVTGSGPFVSTPTQIETVNPAAPSKLAFTTAAQTLTAGVCSTAITVQSQDSFNNPSNPSSTETLGLATSSTVGTFYSDNACTTTITSASIPSSANSAAFFYKDTKAASPTITVSGSGPFSSTPTQNETVNPGPASKLVFTTTVQGQTATLQPVTSGALGGNVTPLPSVFVAVQDANGNVVTTGTGSTASITISSTPANVGGTITVAAVNGVATFSNLQFTIAGTYTLTATSTGVTSAVSNPFTLTSNITVTITSTFTTVLIEDLAGKNTFTATANNDPNVPSLGVTWIMVSCSGSPVNTNNATSCGQVAPNGAYTPPSRVPLIPANTFTVQATAVADPSKTATSGSITIKSSILLTMPSISALIGAPVDFTPRSMNGNVNLGTGANQSDLNLGVTLAITGTCIAPPNYTFSGNDGNGCGSFNGNQTASPPTYTYTAPQVVPMSQSCSASPVGCLGTQNKAMITVTAMSVADPNQPSASTTFVISSNISFAIAVGTDPQTMKDICNPFFYPPTDATLLTDLSNDPCGFMGWPANNNLSPPAPTLAVGFQAALAEAQAPQMPNPSGFGSVAGFTWVVPTGSGSVQPASGTSTTFTAPTMVPATNSGNVTITAYPIADFTRPQTFSMPIVASKLIPHNFLATAPFTPVIPFTLTVPSGQSSGMISLDFLGPTSGTIAFTCSGFVKLSNSSCSFTPPNPSATGTTTVTMTLTVTRTTGGTYLKPPGAPLAPSPGLPETILAMTLLMFLILAFATRKGKRSLWAPASSWKGASAAFLLCALVLTWAVACGQFSQPGTPKQPIGGTPNASGSATVMGTPTSDASPSTDSLAVPATVLP